MTRVYNKDIRVQGDYVCGEGGITLWFATWPCAAWASIDHSFVNISRKKEKKKKQGKTKQNKKLPGIPLYARTLNSIVSHIFVYFYLIHTSKKRGN